MVAVSGGAGVLGRDASAPRGIDHGRSFLWLISALDCLAVYATGILAGRLTPAHWMKGHLSILLVGMLSFSLLTSYAQLYRSWRLVRLRYELLKISYIMAAVFTVVSLMVFAGLRRYVTQPDIVSLGLLIGTWFVLALAAVGGSRIVGRLFLRYHRASGHDNRTVAFFGDTRNARALVEVFRKHPWMGINVAAVLGDEEGAAETLVALARSGEISAVYITLAMQAEHRVKAVVDLLSDTTASIYYCPDVSGLGLVNARWEDIFGHAVVSVVASPFDDYKSYLKRAEDLAIALVALPAVTLVVAVLALLVRLTSEGPAFYRQSRYGLGGRPFDIIKLRTMRTTDSDAEFVQARKDDSRITPLGAVLRRTSLDELPQFFNVLAGDMSVVGPRPAPIKYNEDQRRVINRYMIRHKVKPGITGLAQVNDCRGETETREKTEMRTLYDIEYINNWSILLDLSIIMRTIALVFFDFMPARASPAGSGLSA